MNGPRPNFIDSPYFVAEPGNWHLKPGAPAEVVREFEAFMKAMKPPRVPLIPEIHEGHTPAGGVLSEVYYFDMNDQPIDKAHASKVFIRELDEKGNLVNETWANVVP